MTNNKKDDKDTHDKSKDKNVKKNEQVPTENKKITPPPPPPLPKAEPKENQIIISTTPLLPPPPKAEPKENQIIKSTTPLLPPPPKENQIIKSTTPLLPPPPKENQIIKSITPVLPLPKLTPTENKIINPIPPPLPNIPIKIYNLNELKPLINKEKHINKQTDNLFSTHKKMTGSTNPTDPLNNLLIKNLDNANNPKNKKNIVDLKTTKKDLLDLLENINTDYSKFDFPHKKNKFDRYDPDKDADPFSKYKITEENKNNVPFTPLPPKEKITITAEINSLDDLLQLIEDNPLIDNAEYNIDMVSMHQIKEPLLELKNMIGMTQLKNNIVDQILYFSQNLHKSGDGDFMHTVIYGPPGTGKTEVAKIMGKIFSKLGVLKTGKFKKVTRSDLVAGYLGQTARLTREVIEESLGGVLFIDEAYALGNSEKRDSFAKECIDTLCEALSNYKQHIMVIIAGYKQELKDCFFAYNKGLESRFTWRFETDDYTPEELRNIFIKKIKDNDWSVYPNNNAISARWFEQNIKQFEYYGRDIETLFSKTKIAHSRRVFCKPKEAKTKVTKEDLENGFILFMKNREKTEEKKAPDISFMYV